MRKNSRFVETQSIVVGDQRTALRLARNALWILLNSQYVNVESFVSDIVSKEISFAKENLIDFRTENGYYFGFYNGAVECLHRINFKIPTAGRKL